MSFFGDWDGTLSLGLRTIGVYDWIHRKMLGRPAARLVEFFGDDAEEASRYPVMGGLLKPGNQVHGLWMTGAGLVTRYRPYLREHRIIRTLVLPRPDNPALAKLIESFGPNEPYSPRPGELVCDPDNYQKT